MSHPPAGLATRGKQLWFVVLRAAVAGGVVFGAALLPYPFNVMGMLLFAAGLFWTSWQMRSSPCVHCGRRATLPVPKNLDAPLKFVQWWDFRPVPRSTYDWKCVDHIVYDLHLE